MVPVPARPLYRMARLFERPTSDASEARLSTALAKLGPSLCEARPVSGDAAGRRRRSASPPISSRLQDKMPPFPQAQAEAAVAASFEQPLARSMRVSVRRSRRPRSRRCTRRRWRPRANRVRSPSRCCGPASSSVSTPISPPLPMRRSAPRPCRRGAAAAPRRSRRDAAPFGAGRNGFSPGSRRAFGNGGEHQGRSGFPRADDRLGPHHQGSADARNGSTAFR